MRPLAWTGLLSARLAGVAALTAPQPALAQGAFDMGLLTQTLSVDDVTQEEEGRPAASPMAGVGQGVSSALSERIAAPSSTDDRRLSYAPSPARRDANFRSFVARTRARDAASADQLRTMFASGQVMAQIEAGIRPYGLTIDNTADAYALWWINAWDVANGRNTAVTRDMAQAVRAQAAHAILATAMPTASDETKQNFAEALLIQAAILGAANEQGGLDEHSRARLAASVRQGARDIALDLTAMELTPDGFVRRDGADADTPRPVAAPAAAPSRAAPAGLPGIWRNDWVENQYQAFGGLTLVARNVTFVFTPGGYFFDEIPVGVGLDDAGAQAWARDHPDGGGRYEVRGDSIRLTYASGRTDDVDARKAEDGWRLAWGSRPLSPKLTFPDGATLSDVYGRESVTNFGTGYVVGDHDFEFTADGRVAYGRRVSMSSAVVSSVGGREGHTGRYRIAGSALQDRLG